MNSQLFSSKWTPTIPQQPLIIPNAIQMISHCPIELQFNPNQISDNL